MEHLRRGKLSASSLEEVASSRASQGQSVCAGRRFGSSVCTLHLPDSTHPPICAYIVRVAVHASARVRRGRGQQMPWKAGSDELPLPVERHLPAAHAAAMMKIYPCIQEH